MIEAINICKTDKNRNVREAAMAALSALKELPGDDPDKVKKKNTGAGIAQQRADIVKADKEKKQKEKERKTSDESNLATHSNYNTNNSNINQNQQGSGGSLQPQAGPNSAIRGTSNKPSKRMEAANQKLKDKGRQKVDNMDNKEYEEEQKPKKQYGINKRKINPAFMKKADDVNDDIIDGGDDDIEIFVNENQQYVPQEEENFIAENVVDDKENIPIRDKYDSSTKINSNLSKSRISNHNDNKMDLENDQFLKENYDETKTNIMNRSNIKASIISDTKESNIMQFDDKNIDLEGTFMPPKTKPVAIGRSTEYDSSYDHKDPARDTEVCAKKNKSNFKNGEREHHSKNNGHKKFSSSYHYEDDDR